jgi:GT2 family glycosyltransferase
MADRLNDGEPFEVDWVSAAAMMASRETLTRVNGLEESFYYFHEHIVCKRLQAAGYKNYLHPQSKVIHFGGAGSGVRTRRIRCLHIKRFHTAAYEWFCIHHNLSRYNPARLFLAAALGFRSAVLIFIEKLKPDPGNVASEIADGRPEGETVV